MMRALARISLFITTSLMLGSCSLISEVGKPPVSIYIVNETARPAVVSVGISQSGADWMDPGTEVAWLQVEPQTYQRLSGIPVGSHLVALVVEPDCSVHMEQPWTWSGHNRDDDPTDQPFWIKGPRADGVEMSGWGLAITPGNPMPGNYREVALNRVANPCPDTNLVPAK